MKTINSIILIPVPYTLLGTTFYVVFNQTFLQAVQDLGKFLIEEFGPFDSFHDGPFTDSTFIFIQIKKDNILSIEGMELQNDKNDTYHYDPISIDLWIGSNGHAYTNSYGWVL